MILDSTANIRLNKKVWADFKKVAKKADTNRSAMIQSFIEGLVGMK